MEVLNYPLSPEKNDQLKMFEIGMNIFSGTFILRFQTKFSTILQILDSTILQIN